MNWYVVAYELAVWTIVYLLYLRHLKQRLRQTALRWRPVREEILQKEQEFEEHLSVAWISIHVDQRKQFQRPFDTAAFLLYCTYFCTLAYLAAVCFFWLARLFPEMEVTANPVDGTFQGIGLWTAFVLMIHPMAYGLLEVAGSTLLPEWSDWFEAVVFPDNWRRNLFGVAITLGGMFGFAVTLMETDSMRVMLMISWFPCYQAIVYLLVNYGERFNHWLDRHFGKPMIS